MPDITMCDVLKCEMATTCRRHPDSGTRPAPQGQSWVSPDATGAQCAMYWQTQTAVRTDQTAQRAGQGSEQGGRLTPKQISALRDAHQSIHCSGLIEVVAQRGRGTVWVGHHRDCHAEHANSTIHFLFTEGLLDRTGSKPMREAQITEAGVTRLFIEGHTA